MIFAKNTQEESDDNSGSGSEADDSSSDESMDGGHPAKKPKIG